MKEAREKYRIPEEVIARICRQIGIDEQDRLIELLAGISLRRFCAIFGEGLLTAVVKGEIKLPGQKWRGWGRFAIDEEVPYFLRGYVGLMQIDSQIKPPPGLEYHIIALWPEDENKNQRH